MDPVEINAGTVYLRQFRADDRIDDRRALIEAFADDAMREFVPQYAIVTLDDAGDYVKARAQGWLEETRCTWAIAEPTTGACVGEVAIKGLTADEPASVAVWTHPDVRKRGVATTAVQAAARFGFGALGLDRVEYRCVEHNAASVALAKSAGFTLQGSISLQGVPGLNWVLTP